MKRERAVSISILHDNFLTFRLGELLSNNFSDYDAFCSINNYKNIRARWARRRRRVKRWLCVVTRLLLYEYSFVVLTAFVDVVGPAEGISVFHFDVMIVFADCLLGPTHSTFPFLKNKTLHYVRARSSQTVLQCLQEVHLFNDLLSNRIVKLPGFSSLPWKDVFVLVIGFTWSCSTRRWSTQGASRQYSWKTHGTQSNAATVRAK